MNREEYKELDIHAVEDIDESPCDIFLVLESGKAFKISSKGNLVNYKMIKKFNGKEGISILVHKDDYPYILKARLLHKVNVMKGQLGDKQWINRLQRFDTELNSIAMVRAMVMNYGINEVTLNLVEETMESTLYSFEKIPSLKTILGDICGRGDFFLQKALMINYLAIFALKKTAWDNENTRNKLSMAAFLHDFKTTDEELIKNPPNDEASIDIKKKFETFKNHAELEANILSKINEVPDDVVKLVRLHHCDLDGTGFPVNEVSKLNPLSQIFNVAHHLSVHLIKNDFSKVSYSGYFYDLSARVLDRYKETIDPYSYLL